MATFKSSGSITMSEVRTFLRTKGATVPDYNVSLASLFATVASEGITTPGGNTSAPHAMSEFYGMNYSTTPPGTPVITLLGESEINLEPGDALPPHIDGIGPDDITISIGEEDEGGGEPQQSTSAPTYSSASPCQPSASELDGFLYDENHYCLELSYLHTEDIGGGAGGMAQWERIRLFYYGSDSPSGVSLTPAHKENVSGNWAPHYFPNGTHDNKLLDLTKLNSPLVGTQNLAAVQWFASMVLVQGVPNAFAGMAIGPANNALQSLINSKLNSTSSATQGQSYGASTSGVVPYRIPTYCNGEGFMYAAAGGAVMYSQLTTGSLGTSNWWESGSLIQKNHGALASHVTAVQNTSSSEYNQINNLAAKYPTSYITSKFNFRTFAIWPIKKI